MPSVLPAINLDDLENTSGETQDYWLGVKRTTRTGSQCSRQYGRLEMGVIFFSNENLTILHDAGSKTFTSFSFPGESTLSGGFDCDTVWFQTLGVCEDSYIVG